MLSKENEHREDVTVDVQARLRRRTCRYRLGTFTKPFECCIGSTLLACLPLLATIVALPHRHRRPDYCPVNHRLEPPLCGSVLVLRET